MNSDLDGVFIGIGIHCEWYALREISYVPGKAALHRTYEDQERLTSTSNDLLQKTRRAEKRK